MTPEPQASPSKPSKWAAAAVWVWAFGYFAAYLPYSALTKALSSGYFSSFAALKGLEIVPIATITSTIGMFVMLKGLNLFRFANHVEKFGLSLPTPTRWTFLSGIATSLIIITTTLAYTFEGVSIPFVMLLLRGGVLMIAPIVDRISKRKVAWYSWVALVLSMLALLDALTGAKGFAMPLLCGVDILVYVLSYFVRLRFMSRLGKSTDPSTRTRFFVEEQMVATPAAVIILAVLALIGIGPLSQLRDGFTELWTSPALVYVILIGLLSQGTGVFGGLVLLDARENSFSVPLNRASSILAGVGAGFLLHAFFPDRANSPHGFELVGAGLLVLAIFVLSFGPKLKLGAAAKT